MCEEAAWKQQRFITFEEFVDLENQNIDYQDSRKRTKLGTAAKDGKLEIVKSLLWNKADPNIVDKDKYTALSMAIRDQ